MNFLYIEQILEGIEINLRILSRGTERYRMLLYQHEGVLGLSERQTKLGNLTDSTEQFRSFLALAKEKNVDLAMTPEYACPWVNIREVIENPDSWPAEGRLWALGAESITPEQLTDFQTQYNGGDKTVYFDQTRLRENGVFLDPLVYLFRGRIDQNQQLIVLIQFKTQHMGVWSGGDLERDRLIEGRDVYIIRNSADSVNLLTVICSEAMNFPAAMDAFQRTRLGWNDRPYLILNPQVNPDPLYDDFITFRKFLFEQERKELIGLNWNLFSKIGANRLLRDGTSRSGIYLTSHEVQFDNHSRVRKNHRLGLYYFYSGRYKHAFILNSKPHAYLIDNLSVNITEGILAQRMRNGPEVMETYMLQADQTLATVTSVSDDHLDCLAALSCKNAFLNAVDNCVLEKERLVCLTAGEFLSRSSNNWSSLEKLFSIRLLATEANKRLTFAEDTCEESELQRRLYVDAVNTLDEEILPDKSRYPESIADLKGYQVFLGYAQNTDGNGIKFIQHEKFRYNLVNQQGAIVKATVCYLGLTTLRRATETFDVLQSMFETDSMNRQRVVVFYKEGLNSAVIADGYAGRFVIAEEKGLSSFLS